MWIDSHQARRRQAPRAWSVFGFDASAAGTTSDRNRQYSPTRKDEIAFIARFRDAVYIPRYFRLHDVGSSGPYVAVGTSDQAM
jgi:hypothetical protein